MPPTGLDWPTVVTILGGLTIVVGALLRYFKWDESWQEPITDLEKRLTKIEQKLENIEGKINTVESNTTYKVDTTNDRMEKAEQKIEKLTDILIKYIGDRGGKSN